jgi:phosphoglycerate dehydrogenase-like enzyme
MNQRRIVISGATFPAKIIDRLTARGLTVDTIPGDLDKEQVVAELDGAWGYVLGGSERMTREVWQNLPQLAVACFMGIGYQTFMQLPDRPTRTVFTYTPHANAQAVAEFTVALMLDLARQVTARVSLVQDGRWTEESTVSLIGARIGIVGMGHVGQEVARMLSAAFNSRIAYWNRSERPELGRLGYHRIDSVEELCGSVEVLAVTAGYNPDENRNMIGKCERAALGEQGLLVNTARAELIDPHALRDALATGQLGGVALDGYYEEPTPSPSDDSYGLLKFAPRILVTPHCAYLSRQAVLRMAEMVAENLMAVAENQTPPYQV